MSCSRCEDIHKAQCEGKTQKECKCSCHNSHTGTTTLGGTSTIPATWTTGTDTTNTGTLSFNDTSATTVTLSSDGDFLTTGLNVNTEDI
ncbi:hypothetical protein LCGC14_0677300 [marine sediment metagenome]|uniref:Uncharacterized protein n=1 Tax=marine sediment metagenome TaxID=412755 RepID=A0A0F9TAQ3_9ZZZZ